MVLNHIAAIFFFSGPLFYIGLVMAWPRQVSQRCPNCSPMRYGTSGVHWADNLHKKWLNWNKLVLPTDYEEPSDSLPWRSSFVACSLPSFEPDQTFEFHGDKPL